MKKSRLSLLAVLVVFIFSRCDHSEKIEDLEEPQEADAHYEIINGREDATFMRLIEPFEKHTSDSRILDGSEYENVKKVTGEDYVNYTLPIGRLNDIELASHSLILSEQNDSIRYALLEIVPDKTWIDNQKLDFSTFTGKINSYPIVFDDADQTSNGRVNTETGKDCVEFVPTDIVVHSGGSATVTGYWKPVNCTGSSGGGGSGGGGYYWTPDWNSSTSGNWSNGGLTGTGGGSGSGSESTGSKYPQKILLSPEELNFFEFDYSFLDCTVNCSFQEGIEAIFQSLPRDLSNNPLNNLVNVLRYVQAWHRGQVPQSHRDAIGKFAITKLIDFNSIENWPSAGLFDAKTAYGDGLRIELQNEPNLALSDVQFNDAEFLIFVESLGTQDTPVIELDFSAYKSDLYFRIKNILQQ